MLWYFYIFLLGLIVGSFANVVIFRVPRGESAVILKKIPWSKFLSSVFFRVSVVSGRSKCANCGKKLAWYDLIPIVSFFVLRFRCRNCRQPISWTYPAVELYSGLIFLASFWFFIKGGLVDWIFVVFVLELFLILALIDFKNLILPDSVMLVMFLGVLMYGVWERLAGSYRFNIFSFNNLISAAILFSVFFILWFFSKGLWLGLGDSKLAGLMGLIFGLWGGLIIIYGAIIAGTIAGLILLAAHHANLKTKLPLGSFICFLATAYIFLGTPVQNWLADFFYSVPLIIR